MKPWCIVFEMASEAEARSGYAAALAALADSDAVTNRPEEIRLVPPEVNSRHALAEALLGIEATTVEEYRDRAHALAMNWKGEV